MISFVYLVGDSVASFSIVSSQWSSIVLVCFTPATIFQSFNELCDSLAGWEELTRQEYYFQDGTDPCRWQLGASRRRSSRLKLDRLKIHRSSKLAILEREANFMLKQKHRNNVFYTPRDCIRNTTKSTSHRASRQRKLIFIFAFTFTIQAIALLSVQSLMKTKQNKRETLRSAGAWVNHLSL